MPPKANVINPLAFPKGVKLSCELCGKPAHLQCADCRVTYYCDKAHQKVDFEGIHEKICRSLGPLRTPVMVLGSEEERLARERETKQREHKLLEICKTEAHKKLFEEEFDLALPPALAALRFSLLVYGPDAVELVPAYLLLGEASIGLKQYAQAEEYLSLARWSVLKSPGCENDVRAQLHRNFGLLYGSQGRTEEALKQLANDIYFSSLSHGPEHMSVAGGYYQLGNMFHKMSKNVECTACYDKVVQIWKKFLKSVTEVGVIDEAQEAEGITTLGAIQSFRALTGTSTSTGAAECTYLLAQLYYRVGKIEQAREQGMRALEAYESTLGREHSITHEVRAFLKSVLGDLQTKAGPRRASLAANVNAGEQKARSRSENASPVMERDRSKSFAIASVMEGDSNRHANETESGLATLAEIPAAGDAVSPPKPSSTPSGRRASMTFGEGVNRGPSPLSITSPRATDEGNNFHLSSNGRRQSVGHSRTSSGAAPRASAGTPNGQELGRESSSLSAAARTPKQVVLGEALE